MGTQETQDLVWEGDESLHPLLVPITALAPHAENPRRGDVSRIAESLKRFGQVRPIVATVEGVIIGGNHTFLAAQSLEWTAVAAVRVAMSKDDALAYLVADNRTSDLASYEQEELADLLGRLSSEGLLDGIGWTYEEIDSFMADMAVEIPPLEEPEEEEREPLPPVGLEGTREIVLGYRLREFEEYNRLISYLERVLNTHGINVTTLEALRRLAEIEGYEPPAGDEV